MTNACIAYSLAAFVAFTTIIGLSVGIAIVNKDIATLEANPIKNPPDFGIWSSLENCTVLNHTFVNGDRDVIDIFVVGAGNLCQNAVLRNYDEYLQSCYNRSVNQKFPIGANISCRVDDPFCNMFRFNFHGNIPHDDPNPNLDYAMAQRIALGFCVFICCIVFIWTLLCAYTKQNHKFQTLN